MIHNEALFWKRGQRRNQREEECPVEAWEGEREQEMAGSEAVVGIRAKVTTAAGPPRVIHVIKTPRL